MYVKKDREQQKQIEFVSLEDLVLKDHILRDIDRSIDFSFQYLINEKVIRWCRGKEGQLELKSL